jgi:hypothetical protein
LTYNFDLDKLPVSFGSKSLKSESLRMKRGEENRASLDGAMRDLVDIIWKEGGFRFFYKDTKEENLTYRYYCSQDSDRALKNSRKSKGIRDGRQMARFSCKSSLTIRPSPNDRTLYVSLRHIYHEPYVNIELSASVREFIDERIPISTPSDIYRDLEASGISADLVTRNQVYYRWQQENRSIWRRNSDPFTSAILLLTEYGYQNWHAMYTSGNVRGLAIFASSTIASLVDSPELAMDATFGTNNSGMDLFAVLAEVDGTGIPLAYCFVEVIPFQHEPITNPVIGDKDDSSKKRRADPGALTHILDQFLRRLKALGFNPTFFGIDKDQSEIAAVRQVWPDVTIQLCYWHVKRAVRTRLKDSKQTKTQSHYWPAEAQKLIPDLEICWGSHPTNRPNDHRYGECSCQSHDQRYEEKGKLETSSTKERDTVLEILCRHFNAHPLIPDLNGTFRTLDMIHRECAKEMYSWCKARDYYRLWAYLFFNWYRSGQWELWARSSNAQEIPVLKTTMIVESHWRKLKHDYLHRFNRPRVDLVVWIIITRVIIDFANRLKGIQGDSSRKYKASWRAALKRQWKNLAGRMVDIASLEKYHTNPHKWVCACDSFLHSRFLICKHILLCYEPIANSGEFFDTLRRQRVAPFWVNEQLVLRPEYKSKDEERDGEDLDEKDSSESDSESDIDLEVLGEDRLADMSDSDETTSTDVRVSKFKSMMQSVMELFDEQYEKGNILFTERFMAAHESDRTLLEEVNRRRNMRTMPPTWGKHKHPLTMYYK